MVPPDAALAARLSSLVATARASHQRFIAARPRAEALAQAAGAPASESWSVAAVALADLDSQRSQAMVPLADLDALHTADRVTNFNEPTGDGLAIERARETVNAWLAEQDAVLDALSRRLGL